MNLSVQHYYLDVLMGKMFVQKRVLKPNKEDDKLKEMIVGHSWALFVAMPLAALMALV